MLSIYCLTDYKDYFGSKWNSKPYRSGFDKVVLKRLFLKDKCKIIYLNSTEISFQEFDWRDKVILYTSSEEYNLLYKRYITDLIIGLKEAGAIVIPDLQFLLANNNKVFMEMLSQIKLPETLHTLPGRFYGTLQELERDLQKKKVDFPCVIKAATGAKSRGVYSARNKKDLLKKARKISKTISIKLYLKELVRKKLHAGYIPESSFQGKFILQPFIEGLKNDWKILIFGEKYFFLKRNVRTNDFRASGSGLGYRSGSESEFPKEMLSFVRNYFIAFDVPNLSLDFGYDGHQGYIFEYQAIHYGTYTQLSSKNYYEYNDGKWVVNENNLNIEEVYVYSITKYLSDKKLLVV